MPSWNDIEWNDQQLLNLFTALSEHTSDCLLATPIGICSCGAEEIRKTFLEPLRQRIARKEWEGKNK